MGMSTFAHQLLNYALVIVGWEGASYVRKRWGAAAANGICVGIVFGALAAWSVLR